MHVSAVFAVNSNQPISSFSSPGKTAIGGTFYVSNAGQRDRWCGDPFSCFLEQLKLCAKSKCSKKKGTSCGFEQQNI